MVSSGKSKSMAGPRGFSTPSHVLYADDTLTFCKGTKANLQVLMSVLDDYGLASGQLLSKAKCKYYVGSMSKNIMYSIINLL